MPIEFGPFGGKAENDIALRQRRIDVDDIAEVREEIAEGAVEIEPLATSVEERRRILAAHHKEHPEVLGRAITEALGDTSAEKEPKSMRHSDNNGWIDRHLS